MTKRYSKLNFKKLLLALIAIVMVAGFISCADSNQLPMGDFSAVDAPTGPLDESGNVITNTQYVTNVITVTNEVIRTNTNLPVRATNWITNWVTNVIKVTNVVVNTDYHPSTKYKVYAPFAGIGREGDYKYTNVSYLDTKTLSELWKAMIQRKAFSGERFIIRNRTSGRYFYFDDNMDLRNSMNPNIILKRFVQGLIIQYKCGNNKGAYAIAGLYKLEHDTKTISDLWDDGINIMQGYLFSQDRTPGEYDILVLNTGHVVNGSEYGFEMYNSVYNYAYGTNPYYEQRPEYYMSKITHVTEAWKNWRPYEVYDLAFKVHKGSNLPNLWK